MSRVRYIHLVAIVMIGAFLLQVTQLKAQETVIEQEWNDSYNRAFELLDKEMYVAAQKLFDQIAVGITEPQNQTKINSTYYAAYCALELFHKDAEYRFRNFITQYPEHTLAKKSYFQLGRYNYRKRKWEKVIAWFDEVDLYELDKDEVAEYYFKLGYSYFMIEDYDQAANAFFEIKDVDTEFTVPATYYFAHIQYMKQQYQAALVDFRRIESADQFKKFIPYYLTQILYHQEKFDELLAYAPPLLDSATYARRKEIARLIGESYYHTEQYKQAIPYLEEYVNHTSQPTFDDYYQLAYAHYKIKAYDKAIPYFQKIAAGDSPEVQTVMYQLGDAYLKLGQKNYARNAFLEASLLDHDLGIKEEALYSYAKLSLELAYDPYHSAIDAFMQFIAQYPKSRHIDEAYEYLTYVYLNTKNYAAVIQSIEKVKDPDKRLQHAYQRVAYNSATEAFFNGQFEKAITDYHKVRKYPIDQSLVTESYYWIAEAFYRLRKPGTRHYERAFDGFKDYIFRPGAILNKTQFADAHYNAGFSQFLWASNLDDKDEAAIHYKDAIYWLRLYLKKEGATPEKIHSALVRIGDAYYIQRDYPMAAEYFQQALAHSKAEGDYVTFQLAMSKGVMGEGAAKRTLLENLVKDFPESDYAVDTKYQLGESYMNSGDYDQSIALFSKVIQDFPNSSKMKLAMFNLGQIYLNQQAYDKALTEFKGILENFPNDASVHQSLQRIRYIYQTQGKLNEYESYLVELGMDLNESSLDSAWYYQAYDPYVLKDFKQAQLGFSKYLDRFENGVFDLDAHYYLAECQYGEGKVDSALVNYEYVARKPLSLYSEASLVRSARMRHAKKDYEAALGHYVTLEKAAENPQNRRMSRIGQMRCFDMLGNEVGSSEYAEIVLSEQKVDQFVKEEAMLIIGRSLYHAGDLDSARFWLDTIVAGSPSIRGAEAQYFNARIDFDRNELKKAEERIFVLVNQIPSYDYWIAKSLILLADVYVKTEDYFQARHTLKSIVDNYQGDAAISEEASTKLQSVIEQENKAQEVEEVDPLEINMTTDEAYESLFEEEESEDEILIDP